MSDVRKHCRRAGCLESCPTGAIICTEFDSVYVQPDVCNGCGPPGLDKTYALPYAPAMKTITATAFRRRLYKLLDEVAVTSEPVQISGRRANAVLVSEADWRALEETVYLSSIPGMADSIREGMATPVEECVEELDW